MAEDEGRDRRGEDLFEDLDKFFAPIQDPGWPEQGAEGASEADDRPSPAEAAPGEGPHAPAADLDAPVVSEEPAVPEPPQEREPEPEPPQEHEPGPEPPAAGGFGDAAAEPPASDDSGWDALPPDQPGSLSEDMFGPRTDPGGTPVAPAGDVFGSGTSGADDDELLPQGWASGLDEGIDLDVDVPPTPAGETGGGERFLGQATEEMSGEDWAELQAGTLSETEEPVGGAEPYSYMEQFLPDQTEPEVPEFGYGPEPGAGAAPSGGTTGIDWDAPLPGGTSEPASLEDSGPISIDDLRRAPDAYRDLPGPDAEPGAAAALGLGAAAAGSVPGPDEEPEAGDLEAAAEHFAASIRDEEPDLGSAPLDPFAAPGTEAAAASDDPFAAEHREPYSDQPEPLVFPGEDDEGADDLLSFGEDEGPRTVKVGATEDAGPSWQEPTSVEVPVEGEHEPPRPGRNLSAAIVTGIVLAVVALIALAIGKVAFGIVAGGVVLLAQLELYTAIRKRGYQPAVPLGLAIGGLICAGGYLKGEGGILAMTALGVLFTPLWYMATPVRLRKNVVANIGMTMLGIMAVPFLGGFALAIIHDASREFTIFVLILAFGYDIAAYGVGTLTGNRPLAPSISPNKTREGAIGGFLVLAIVAIFLESVAPISSYVESFGMAFAAGLAALLGDLAESLMKRDLGVKDMGTVFPGHGGALDRIDSVLFVAPVVFYFVRIFVF